MAFELPGTPSDQLPEVIATGVTDVDRIFVSLSAREGDGRDRDYLVWHSLDHRPEQYRLSGLRHSIRLVSTPACRALRAAQKGSYEEVDHVMTYFFTADAAFEQFNALSQALGGGRRPFRLPSVAAGYFSLAGKIASPAAVAGADVIPWRPATGVYLLIEESEVSPDELVDIDGVAGIWWHRACEEAKSDHSSSVAKQATYCFLDADPLKVAADINKVLEKRWADKKIAPLLAAPFYTLVPFEWDRYLP